MKRSKRKKLPRFITHFPEFLTDEKDVQWGTTWQLAAMTGKLHKTILKQADWHHEKHSLCGALMRLTPMTRKARNGRTVRGYSFQVNMHTVRIFAGRQTPISNEIGLRMIMGDTDERRATDAAIHVRWDEEHGAEWAPIFERMEAELADRLSNKKHSAQK